MSSITYGNGLVGTIGYDNQYRISGITAGAVVSLSYPTYDNNGNIQAIQDLLDPTKGLDLGGMILLNMDPLDLFDRRLIRASRGYMFSLPIMTASTKDFLNYCKSNDETLLVTAMEAEKTVDEIASIPERLLIVFGSEKEGCSPEIEQAATMQVRIPISNKVESLNVSAAAGITLFNRTQFNRK